MRTFTIDGKGVESFRDFVAAVNAGFVGQVGGDWNGNLDALNDYLSWPDEEMYDLELLDSATCAQALNHAAHAAWLRHHIPTCHPSNVAEATARLEQAEAGLGETLFDVIIRIIADNQHARFVLR